MTALSLLLAGGIGALLGWIAHTVVTEPERSIREQHLVDAYSQGWHARERFGGDDDASRSIHL